MSVTVTTQDVLNDIDFDSVRYRPVLPDGWTGIHWTDTDWTECRAHIEDPSWRSAVPHDDGVGVVLTGDVDCDACAAADDDQ